MIFGRLRSYVLYRLAATIQIVLVLSFLIYGYNDPLPALYVILLALLNDVTMLPVAADNATPSALPEIPSMPSILLASLLYGVLETVQTMALYLSGWLKGDGTYEYRSAVVYLQISIAIELLIFSCRTPSFVFSPSAICSGRRPTLSLTMAVLGANVLVSLLAGFGDTFNIIYKVEWVDIAWIWLYDICGLIVIDALKYLLGLMKLGWMSAGAAGGTLEYAELPPEADGRGGIVLRSTSIHSRSHASARSVAAARSLGGGVAGAGSGGSGSFRRQTSESMLPYPYNLRAAATRHFNSF